MKLAPAHGGSWLDVGCVTRGEGQSAAGNWNTARSAASVLTRRRIGVSASFAGCDSRCRGGVAAGIPCQRRRSIRPAPQSDDGMTPGPDPS